MSGSVESFEIAVAEATLEDLRDRLARTRWPAQPPGTGWEFGADFEYLRELCEYWRDGYDWRACERRINAFSNWRRDGIHFIRERADGRAAGAKLPICLIHGWPGAPIEFLELIPLLVGAGHDVVVPSLPGFAFSEPPAQPLNAAAIAAALLELMGEGLGYRDFAVQGGDWGSMIAARMAFEAPETVRALHTNAPSVLPVPGAFDDPPLSEREQRWIAQAQRWRTREGFHLIVQGMAPDALAAGLNDSPLGLAAWLAEKYRRWSDCGGEIERRFSKDDLCDFLTLYWATGTIAPSLRLYGAEGRDRWRLRPGETISVAAAVADFPAEILRPPRAWTARQLSDLRRWTEMPRGGHFAAFEEPRLLADDLIAFLATLG